eukprot:364937-Chlamydomonas_euryale.AAC.9
MMSPLVANFQLERPEASYAGSRRRGERRGPSRDRRLAAPMWLAAHRSRGACSMPCARRPSNALESCGSTSPFLTPRLHSLSSAPRVRWPPRPSAVPSSPTCTCARRRFPRSPSFRPRA